MVFAHVAEFSKTTEPPQSYRQRLAAWVSRAMLRILTFLTALLLVAGGFAQAVVDGTRIIGADHVSFTALQTLADMASTGFTERLHLSLDGISPLLWKPVLAGVFAAPAFLVMWAAGFVLYLLSRKRQPRIGTSNRDRG